MNIYTFPKLTAAEVAHVGTFNAADRKTESYEGDGLSVSVNPDEWADIARLGGDTHTITRRDGKALVFVDVHALTDEQKIDTYTYGLTNGWIAEQTMYRVSYFDDEMDDTMSFHLDTREDAEGEAEAFEDAEITKVRVFRATDTFPMERVDRHSDPLDMLILHRVRECPQAGIDGVWWTDTYSPERLSCPRGAIAVFNDQYQSATGLWED